jgi:uncharacterized protein YjbI with pentapeptide repeats
MKSSIRAIAMALLLSGAVLPLYAQPSSDCSPIPEKIDSSQILNMITQHKFYLDWERSAQYQRDHALQIFNWSNFHADQKDSQALDPLSTAPPGADRFSAEKKDFGGYIFNRGPLDEAIFHGSNLAGTKFIGTSLKNASFDGWARPDCGGTPVQTVLVGAEFRDADLSDASFAGADMTGVVFEPAALPDADGIADARNLEQMTFDENPSPLLRLRQAFRDGGFDEQDRKIGYAIHRRLAEQELKKCSRNIFSACITLIGYRFADWTCQYGWNLWRPVEIGFVAWLVFALIFFLFMHHPGPSGLYLAVATGIVLDDDAIKNAPQVRSLPLASVLHPKQLSDWARNEARLVKIAIYFSLINGFNLGFKDADIGRWIRLLPWREFEFRALGWSRTFAGVQSLITLYLVAIWVLCVFGHPFG